MTLSKDENKNNEPTMGVFKAGNAEIYSRVLKEILDSALTSNYSYINYAPKEESVNG